MKGYVMPLKPQSPTGAKSAPASLQVNSPTATVKPASAAKFRATGPTGAQGNPFRAKCPSGVPVHGAANFDPSCPTGAKP